VRSRRAAGCWWRSWISSVVAAGNSDSADMEVFARVLDTHLAVLQDRYGFDPFYGRWLTADLGRPDARRSTARATPRCARGGGDGNAPMASHLRTTPLGDDRGRAARCRHRPRRRALRRPAIASSLRSQWAMGRHRQA
jgi:hypothetical protein